MHYRSREHDNTYFLTVSASIVVLFCFVWLIDTVVTNTYPVVALNTAPTAENAGVFAHCSVMCLFDVCSVLLSNKRNFYSYKVTPPFCVARL